MRRIALAALAVVTAVTLVACNTIEGVGKDVKAAGGAVENTARNTK